MNIPALLTKNSYSMKKILFSLCLYLLVFGISGQNTKNLKIINNSEQIIRKAMNIADQGRFDDAIALYNQVPYGDSNYEYAQYEKAYALELAERYQEAIQTLNELLANPSCTQPLANIYTELGNCYDNLEDYGKAVAYYDKGLVTNPYYYHLHFNKGVSLMRQEKYTEALESFKTSMFLNPAHQGSHFQYGQACLRLGYTVPGIMALNYCTLINPSTQYTILALRILNEIYDSGVGSFNADNHYTLHEDYKELNKYYGEVVRKLNLSIISQRKEKCLSKIDHAVTRGNQVVFQNVQVRPNSHTVEDQLYIPFFKQVMEKKLFNTLCYYQFSNTDIENGKVSAKANKMTKEMDAFQQIIIDQLNDVIEKGLNKENPDDTHYIYDQYLLYAWGKASVNEEGKLVQQGVWTTIDQTGQLDETTTYKDGDFDGIGISYSNNRKTAEVNMLKGMRHGFIRTYANHPYGDESVLTFETKAANDKVSGPYKRYYESGILEMECTLDSDQNMVGEFRFYDPQGHLSGIENYVDGKLSGTQSQYYPNGQLKGTYEADGTQTPHPFVSYYSNGRVFTQGQVANNIRTGSFTERYPDGTLMESYSYNDKEEFDGEYLCYYPNGKIRSRSIYKDGKPDGDYTEYDYDGKPVITCHFKNGQYTDAETYMPDGSVRATTALKDKHLTNELYTSMGRKLASVTRNAKLELDGKHITYYPNGGVAQERNFKNGNLNGVCKEYYPSGQVFIYAEYKNGTRDGLLINYFDDKAHTVSRECQFRNDTMVGANYIYLEDGTLSCKELYDPNGLLVYCAYYMPNGKMSRELRYYNGLPLLVSTFDTDGKLVHCDTILFGNGHSDFYYPNGRIMASREIQGGKPDGAYTSYFLNGEICSTHQNISNMTLGVRKSFYPTGEVMDSSSSTLDIIDGYELSYNPLGRPVRSAYFGGSEYAQHLIFFYPDGKLLAESGAILSERHGPTAYYAPDGKTLLMELIYDNGSPYLYRFRQPDGQMSNALELPKEHTLVTAFYPNGKSGLVMEIENGLRNGSFVIYHPNGQAAHTAQYVNEETDGQATFFMANGKTSVLHTYDHGDLHGAMEFYYENGLKAYEGNYYHGLGHGDFKKYDKSGKLVRKVSMYYDRCTADERY